MSKRITARQFQAADGVEDWRVLGDGVCTYLRTDSFETSARLVSAMSALAGLDQHHPDIDLRRDGMTVRLISTAPDYFGLTERDVELAREISRVAGELGVSADPSVAQSVLVIVEGLARPETMPFWGAVLGYERRSDSP